MKLLTKFLISLALCVQLPAAVDSMNRFEFAQKADDFSASSTKNLQWDLNNKLKMVVLDPVNEYAVLVEIPASAFQLDGWDTASNTHYGTLKFVTDSMLATALSGVSLTPGPTGATGAAGTNGTNGTNGATGSTGAAGTNGTNGTNATTTANATGSVAGLESAADKTKLDGIHRQEYYSGTTNGSGLYTVTFSSAFSAAPNIQQNPTNLSSDNIFTRVTAVSTTGFTVLARTRTDALGLLPAFAVTSGITLDVIVTEK